MKPRTKYHRKVTLSIVAGLAVLGLQGQPSWAAASAITAPLAALTGLGVFATLTAGKSTLNKQDKDKQILAAAAIEDAAQFYGSGEIKGVLSLVMKELRVASPEYAEMSDEELIDLIVESAEQVLEAETKNQKK